jgi:sodium pump decarboxylase gamma subunit
MATWWSQVQGTAMEGLQITFVGMSLVFLTLGLIIITMVVLTRLPGLRSAEASPEVEETADEPAVEARVLPPSTGDDELERIAAIAVAIIRSKRRSRRASRPRIAANAWKQAGRARQLGL